MDYSIVTIPHEKQRYDTVGDWIFNKDFPMLHINISNLDSEKSEFLVAIHEMIEAYLCRLCGVDEIEVDKWDMNFKDEGEPGDDKDCPYYPQHQLATSIEKLLCEAVGLSWEEHEHNIDSVYYR